MSLIRVEHVESVWSQIREHLEREKRRINEEINNYPPPIPACDAQYNYLLEERGQIFQEISRLEALNRGNLTPEERMNAIIEFVLSSHYAGDEQR